MYVVEVSGYAGECLISSAAYGKLKLQRKVWMNKILK
jgi:hypothetical protein